MAPTAARARWLAPVLLALSWGLNWPAIKIILGTVPPFTLRGIGLGAGALLLAAVTLARGRSLRPPASDWRAVLIGGLFTVAAFNFCTAFAQLATTTTRATVLTYTFPMLAAALAWLWLGERPGTRGAWALLLGATGIGALAWPVLRGLADPAIGAAPGLAFPLLAAAMWAIGTVATKRWPPQGDRLVLTAWQLALGALAGALAAWLAGETLPRVWPPGVLLALAFHVGAAMALAYVLWYGILARSSATTAALTTLAVPVVGVLGAMALVGERPGALDLAGFALVLGGAALVTLRR
jgi:drug/metabolite transporter (DMT)-like permease